MPPQSFYIDTEILMFYFSYRHDMRRIANDAITQVKTSLSADSEIRVKVPQVVLGEVMLNYCRDGCDIYRIKRLMIDLRADKPTVSRKVLEMANYFLDHDYQLKPNDAVIASHAMVDSTTKWLITTDLALIGNRVILGKMSDLGHAFTIDSKFQ